MNRYGELLIQAVQDTLETMAFAEVIPYAMQIGKDEYHRLAGHCPSAPIPSLDPMASSTSWGDDVPASSGSGGAWGDEPVATRSNDGDDAWGTVGNVEAVSSLTVDDWGGKTELPPQDSWGEAALLAPVDEFAIPALVPKVVNFDEMVSQKDAWCRACMRVNSPDVHSVWFIVSQDLAVELAGNMYDASLEVDSNLIRDLVAEITNILGGRMMLLLERLGGKFTLTVPEIDFLPPDFTDDEISRMVTCHVIVDGRFPVISSIVFSGEIKGNLAGDE
ncbi:MAG: hypothetical protein ACRC46_14930 [Thermoguttaceae bacterium]